MAGRVKQMIDAIVSARAKGNPAVAQAVKAKFVFKGINPDHFNSGSADDPSVIKKLEMLAKELGVTI